ncbi:TPA: acyltransferase [Enterobacter hormaechei]|uniref:acyltransferase n=1 Tax=Enterobacter hormaechei TaxID=158836 RepID=UPI00285BFC48|nr:acyltransferase [Enterobacter hormaechei]ELD3466227.1 acyltransferase [Enterobacter hormaechei]MED5732661.1 acyltransferase [Enterobacter hormaechei]HBM2509493.1 acyltransferase [Enterobacter hormaechei]HBM2518989.1 acyltransferase [Enterobacter hormaechei]HBM2528526.1 acyltransferase [Enterobacter hormaechei]
MAILTREEIEQMGFASVGENVLISKKASFYGISKIHIGNNVRIDDFCVISAGAEGVFIGNYVHIAVYSSLIGAGRITLMDYSNISSRVSIYSSNDDYSGNYMSNPMVPTDFTNVTHDSVVVGKHVIIGSGSIVLPGVTLNEGCAIGALSLVKNSCDTFTIYAGNPARRIRERSKKLLALEAQLNTNIQRAPTGKTDV